MTKHSLIVGGSSCSRLIACPGSKALCDKMPKQQSNSYMDDGTLCHKAMSLILGSDIEPTSVIGMKYEKSVLDQDMYDEKIDPALDLLNDVDPNQEMVLVVDAMADFGEFLPGVFGEADLLGRIDLIGYPKRAIVLDFKFGSGVIVDAVENKQMMFYGAAAMRTPGLEWVFDDAEEVELVIIQPPEIRRWVTTVERLKRFELELKAAVIESAKPNAPLKVGEHCRFCTAKPTCPQYSGAVDRALKVALRDIDAEKIGVYLNNAELLEQWITDLRALAHTMLENGVAVPGWKMVEKRASRKWAIDSGMVYVALEKMGLTRSQMMEEKFVTPPQAEKLLKKLDKELPADLVVKESSGNTLAPESDKRPAVLNIGNQLAKALSKI